MRPTRYGEDQPDLADDRLPVILLILDGLGDRPIPELGGMTPSEAAHTPVLDRLTRRGASGWHVPFGWGRAPASEIAHWSMFGYAAVPFPGRAVLEGLGAGIEVAHDIATSFGAFRTSTVRDGKTWITGRTTAADASDVDLLCQELSDVLRHYAVSLAPMGRGEALLQFTRHAHGDVTDSDPFFENFHPFLRVLAITDESLALAADVNAFLLACKSVLAASAVNRGRTVRGLPALDVLTTKWSGTRRVLPDFLTQTGVTGAAVTDMRMYRGLATLLGMRQRHLAPVADLASDLAARIELAREMIAQGARFIHIHSKATDEAGHTKLPRAKLDAIEAIDPALAALEQLADECIVAITGDHATPSVDGVLHTADPTPLLLVGPTVRCDRVSRFGESSMRDGWYGRVEARELLPLLFSHANRPAFMGHRTSRIATIALPDAPEAMPLDLEALKATRHGG